MVQVDVFWSYSLGAGFALAATRQLEKVGRSDHGGPFRNHYYTNTLLFLALAFAPSGICLLWAFPSWETMHVGDRSLPAWLVTAFAVTNVTQGILGFWVTYKLLMKKKRYLAALQTWVGYFLLFFILVHGWDGTGYQRFFSYTKLDFLSWDSSRISNWATSPVALTLYGMGVILIPWLLMVFSTWLKEGYHLGDVDQARAKKRTRFGLSLSFLALIWVYALLPAIAASLIIKGITIQLGPVWGWVLGIPVFSLLAYFLLLRRGGLLYRWADGVLLPQDRLS